MISVIPCKDIHSAVEDNPTQHEQVTMLQRFILTSNIDMNQAGDR